MTITRQTAETLAKYYSTLDHIREQIECVKHNKGSAIWAIVGSEGSYRSTRVGFTFDQIMEVLEYRLEATLDQIQGLGGERV